MLVPYGFGALISSRPLEGSPLPLLPSMLLDLLLREPWREGFLLATPIEAELAAATLALS
jgi:hypothetical protein